MTGRSGQRSPGPPLLEAVARLGIRSFCRIVLERGAEVRVRGPELVPDHGPVVVASRHFHHLYDAAVLMSVLDRPLHFLVALDWIHGPGQRRLMEWACRAAWWPALLRSEQLAGPAGWAGPGRAYAASEAGPYLRRALGDSLALLRAGRALVVFPEAYPTVDPEGSPKRDEHAILPFRRGFSRLVALAERSGSPRVPVVPAGFWYEPGPRWRIALRFGPPLFLDRAGGADGLTRAVEEQVRALSAPPRADADEGAFSRIGFGRTFAPSRRSNGVRPRRA